MHQVIVIMVEPWTSTAVNVLVKTTPLTTSGNLALVSTCEPQRPKIYLLIYARSEDSDQTAHSRSLIRIFTGRILDSKECNVSSDRQRRLWSDCADA